MLGTPQPTPVNTVDAHQHLLVHRSCFRSSSTPPTVSRSSSDWKLPKSHTSTSSLRLLSGELGRRVVVRKMDGECVGECSFNHLPSAMKTKPFQLSIHTIRYCNTITCVEWQTRITAAESTLWSSLRGVCISCTCYVYGKALVV